jgi:hypothetical protein
VAPAGTRVYGRVNSSQSAGRAFGRSTLSINLTDISINGKLVRIATSSSLQSGMPSGDKRSFATMTEGRAVREIKEWQSIMDYIRSLPVKTKGELPMIPVDERASEVRAIKVG